MSKTFDAPFPQDPRTASPVLTLACVLGLTNEPTNTLPLFTAGPEGAVLTGLWCMPCGAVPATGLYLFRSPAGNQTKKYFIDSEVMPALSTFSATVKIAKVKFSEYSELSTLRLGAGESLHVGIGTASPNGIVFFAQETEYDDPA